MKHHVIGGELRRIFGPLHEWTINIDGENLITKRAWGQRRAERAWSARMAYYSSVLVDQQTTDEVQQEAS